jgi:hypothetical protein
MAWQRKQLLARKTFLPAECGPALGSNLLATAPGPGGGLLFSALFFFLQPGRTTARARAASQTVGRCSAFTGDPLKKEG